MPDDTGPSAPLQLEPDELSPELQRTIKALSESAQNLEDATIIFEHRVDAGKMPKVDIEKFLKIEGAVGVGLLATGASRAAPLIGPATVPGAIFQSLDFSETFPNDPDLRLRYMGDFGSAMTAPTPFMGPGLDPVGMTREFGVILGDLATDSVEAFKTLAEGAETWIEDRLGSIFDGAKERNREFLENLADMSDEAVGRSIIPDMVEGIGDWFGKLDGLMVEPTNVMTESVQAAFGKMGDGVANTIGGMVKGAKVNFDSLRDLARSVLQDLQSTLVNRLVVSPLRGGFDSFLTNLFTPRASGGDVSGGKPFLVGERGPELFVPDVSGVIQPNSQPKGSNRPTVIFNVDMKGASLAAVQKLEQIVRLVNGSIERRAINAVANEMARTR